MSLKDLLFGDEERKKKRKKEEKRKREEQEELPQPELFDISSIENLIKKENIIKIPLDKSKFSLEDLNYTYSLKEDNIIKIFSKEIFENKNYENFEIIKKKYEFNEKIDFSKIKNKIPFKTPFDFSDIIASLNKEETLRQELAPEFRQYTEKHGEVDSAYQPTWFELASRSDKQAFLALPKVAFILTAQAYEFARQSESLDQFFEGFRQSLAEGTAQLWAKTIVDYFRENSVGGGQSRMMGARVA